MLIAIGITIIIIAIIWMIINAIKAILKALGLGIYGASFWTYYNYKVAKPLKESEYMQKKKLDNELKHAEREQKHKEQILNEQNKMVKVSLATTREYRVRYPYANEELFQEFTRRFPSLSVPEIKRFEDLIKQSHLDNEINCKLTPKTENKYTLADLNGSDHLEEYREDPLIMRIFKIENDYLLSIKDLDSNQTSLYQSEDYLIVSRVAIKIIEKQKELRIQKLKIESQQIDEIYKLVNNSVSIYRNNNGYIG